jgi:hypothetical protein
MMQEETVADSQSVVCAAYTAFQRGDVPAVLELMAPVTQFNYYGAVPWAGERKGKDEIASFFQVLASTLSIEVFDLLNSCPRERVLPYSGARVPWLGKQASAMKIDGLISSLSKMARSQAL